MIMNKHLLYTLFTLLSLSFFSCTNEMTDSRSGIGSVSFSVTNNTEDVVIETRSSLDIDSDDLFLNLTRGNESLFTNKKYSELEKSYSYAAGSDYKITAQNCTEAAAEEGWGQDRVYGEETFSIEANTSKTVTVECRLANSGISVSFSDYVKANFPDCELKLYAANDEGRTFIFTSKVYKRAYFNVDANEKRAIQYILRNGKEELHTSSLTLEPGHYYNLSVKVENESSLNPYLTIGISIDGELVDEEELEEIINPYK